ncbi:site-specific integrase [Niveibacterium terrae]|uniref:site-specific integrase n=1 Tax=Niveibacterium terrae TaxID=3373598 RepID=UPI003A8FF585
MASIENRSRFEVTVRNRDDLTQIFAHNAKKRAEAYCKSLSGQGLKPKLARLDDYYVVRDRSRSRKDQMLRANSKVEAESIRARLESEQQQGLFIDYSEGFKISFADLMIRYLREEAPRQKSFEVVGYKINAMLEDAGCPRQELARIVAEHPNPHPKVKAMRIRAPTGVQVRESSEASKFIRKGFASIVPDDFRDYIDERCQVVAPATVDREIDIFSAVCRIAIDSWRIHAAKSPMDGVRRPRYYNERDRRLKGDEEARLLRAAHVEDRARSIEARLDGLVESKGEGTHSKYGRIRARRLFMDEAEATHEHVPLLETFVHFQLMTGARRSETLSLTWDNVDLDAQTAFLPETKNGRSRKLALRSDLVALLRGLPQDDECVFPISVDGLRKAWGRICMHAGLVGEDSLHIHDLRHEAISSVAEAGRNTPGGFSLIDLQHFSGHRDVRMLMRYAHLCTQALAKRLDVAFGSNKESVTHRGRLRLKAGASVTLKDVLDEQSAVAQSVEDDSEMLVPAVFAGNVVRLDFQRRAV